MSIVTKNKAKRDISHKLAIGTIAVIQTVPVQLGCIKGFVFVFISKLMKRRTRTRSNISMFAYVSLDAFAI